MSCSVAWDALNVPWYKLVKCCTCCHSIQHGTNGPGVSCYGIILDLRHIVIIGSTPSINELWRGGIWLCAYSSFVQPQHVVCSSKTDMAMLHTIC